MRHAIRSSAFLKASLLPGLLSLAGVPILPAAPSLGTTELAAQQLWEGTIEGFDGDEAQVAAGLSPGMMPFVIGTVTASGSFSVTLDEGLWDEFQASEESGSMSGDFVVSSVALGEAFACPAGGVDIQGEGDQPMQGLMGIDGTLGVANFQDEILYGYFMAGSSTEYWETLSALGMLGYTPGFHMDWLYVEAPVRVEGRCTEANPDSSWEGAAEQVTTYYLELKPGWNLIKYEVVSVHENADGPDLAAEVSWTSLQAVPGDARYIWIPEER